MSTTIPVLILDDGELDDLAAELDRLGIVYKRLRGAEIGVRRECPRDLLAVTARHASVVPADSVAPADAPLRIVAVTEDSNTMRDMLRRKGFDLLVRRPTHPEIWRLLIQRALYQGDERRAKRRVPIGSAVVVRTDRGPTQALLLDLSALGCRLLTSRSLGSGTPVTLEMPSPAPDRPAVHVTGRVLRTAARSEAPDVWTDSAVVLFDAALRGEVASGLSSLLGGFEAGSGGETDPAVEAVPLPGCESPTQTGMIPDLETGPALTDAIECSPGTGDGGERRRRSRSSFSGPVKATGSGLGRILIGRDLSSGGMRVERLPGLEVDTRLDLAIYGPGRKEPFRVKARVVRDDGDQGFALRFEDLPDKVADDLERIVAHLPDVESLQEGEAECLGSVLSEILASG